MSCLDKIHIRNSIAPYKRSGFDKPFMDVPCGVCPACRKSHSNDLLVRTYFEFTTGDYSRDFSAFFVTLDFDDDHLPRYNGFPCFDSEVIKAFFKRLRHYLPNFRYLYVTEFGSALQRPHYHVIFTFKDHVSKAQFFKAVGESWKQGRHTQIDKLRSVQGSLLKAFTYICSYATKDLSFNFDGAEKFFPRRYQPRCQPSNHWGFNALEEGYITPDMLRHGDPVILPIGKNGKLIPFKIPLYYERQLTHYSVYYPKFRLSEWFLSDFGKELKEIRHNVHYSFLLDQLKASFTQKIHLSGCFQKFKELYPDSLFLDMKWHEMLNYCWSFGDEFNDFLYISPFLKRSKDFVLLDYYGQCLDTRFDGFPQDHLVGCYPLWSQFNQLLHLFRLYKQELDFAEFQVKSFLLVEESKKRLIHKIENRADYRAYLRKSHFDFSKLHEGDIVDFLLHFDFHKLKSKPVRRVSRHIQNFMYFKVQNFMSN